MIRLAALLSFVPTVALAHPGHGTTEPQSWTHYLREPIHAALLGGAVISSILLGRVWQRFQQRE